jgi:hypothetical protein
MNLARTVWLALAVVVSVCAGKAEAAPAPAPAEQWEYAEISTTSTRMPARFGDGPALPGQPDRPPRGTRQTVVRFATAAGEVEAPSWGELAAKLKAPEARSGAASVSAQRLRVLNHLGSQGWELVSGGGGAWSPSTGTMLFKRKVRK